MGMNLLMVIHTVRHYNTDKLSIKLWEETFYSSTLPHN